MQIQKSVTLKTGSMNGTDYHPTTVEVSVLPGKLKLSIVGLNSSYSSMQSCESRISAALFNSGFKINQAEYIISVTPGYIKKSGTHYDVVIIAAILYTNGYINSEAYEFIMNSPLFGEVSLSGNIKLFSGMFSLCLGAKNSASKSIVIPKEGVDLVNNIPGLTFIPLTHINELRYIHEIIPVQTKGYHLTDRNNYDIDMSDIYGQNNAKRAIEIAAAGNHHCILFGPPGCGKTMLSRVMQTILPRLTEKEIIEVNSIYSSAGILNDGSSLMSHAPFRAPHHSSSIVGLVGGGKVPFPGDVTLAHKGVLFLDEFLEFSGQKIEMLRQVLEDRKIYIKKNDYEVTYPASFILVAAFNPCPCGFYGSKNVPCKCSLHQIKSYLKPLSGPILDRIDMQVSMDTIDLSVEDRRVSNEKESPIIAARVESARALQYKRYGYEVCNADVPARILEDKGNIADEVNQITMTLFKNKSLSMRSHFKALRVARTIADLEGCEPIEKRHFIEALSLRGIDKILGA